MVYYCNKCGRKIEMTKGELNAQQGQVVCPQCLAVFKVPRSDAPPPPIPAKSSKKKQADDVPPVPQRRSSTQPAQRSRSTTTTTARTTHQVKSSTVARKSVTKPAAKPARKRPATKMSGGKKSLFGFGWNNMTPLGCLTLSVVIALVFFVFYYIFGELMK